MSDPFSVTGSAVGVVSLGLTICQGFLAYYGPWKAYAEEIQDFTSRVDNLQTLLQVLEGIISEAQDLNLSFERYQNLVLANLRTCHQACQRLKEMLQKCKADGTSTDGMQKHDWLQWKRARYPFKKDTLVSQSRAVADFQNDLTMALQILHTATIQHQQKQLQELTSRSSSIDLRTTQILTTVESRNEALIPSMKEMLKQESLIIQHGYRPILQPASLKQLVDQQVSMNRRFRSRSAGSSRCTCASIPWGSRSTISFFALFLHEKTCPLHQIGQKITSFGAKYTFCNRVLGLSLQMMMTIEQKAGSLSMAPSLHMRWMVADDSPAFELLRRVRDEAHAHRWASMALYLEDARRTLFQMFDNGQASPTDMLRNGWTLLHAFAAIVNRGLDAPSLVVARGFVKALIDAEVPLQERDVYGRTALDWFIWCKLYSRMTSNKRWRSENLELPEELSGIYSDLFSSGSLLTSPTPILGKMQGRLSLDFLDFDVMRRLIVRNLDEEYILSDVELAVLTRSEEGLLKYIASPPQSDIDSIILMCVNWPQGMALILNSPLSLHIKSLLNAFIQACKAGDAECAVILIEATEVITELHLNYACLNDRPDILDVVVPKIATQRRELQGLALRLLSSQEALQLGLPTEHLLDVHALKVYKKLRDRPLAKELEPITEAYSVYGCTLYNRDMANRLFEAGFKDLNQSDQYGRTPLMLLWGRGLYTKKNFADVLNYAQWMVSRGANLYQKSRAGYPAIYYLADTLGDYLHLHSVYWFDTFIRGPFQHEMLSLEKTSVDLLHTILLDDTQDSCSCACSLGGCRPLTRMLRSLYRNTGRSVVDAMMPDVFHCFHDVLLRGSLGDSIPTLIERVLRYVTFEKLGIKHTCHFNDRPLDTDELVEIRDEERDNIALLEDLLVEFNRKYQELGLRIDEFLDGYWTDRMDEVLSVDSEIETHVIRSIRELGVVLSDQTTTKGD